MIKYSRKLSRLASLAAILTLAVFSSAPGFTETSDAQSWQTISNPETNKGLVINPRFLTVRSKIMLFWSGTSLSAVAPEIFLTDRGQSDEQWNKTRAPFFGADLGRIRSLSVATARDTMGILFERETTQGNGAMEVMMSMSQDFGYSFGSPFLLDSFVLGDSNGSSVALAARQGTQRPEFAAGWVSEGGKVKASTIDTRRDSRPETAIVGEVANSKTKVDMVGCGRDGFYMIWPENRIGLRSAHLRPLVGGADPATTLVPGDFTRNFGTSYLYRGPGVVVASGDGGSLQSYRSDSGAFKEISTSKETAKGRNLETRCSVDEKQRIHRVVLNSGENKLYYQMLDGTQWTPLELVCELSKDVKMTGFDVVATEDYVWVVAAQSQIMKLLRHPLKN